MLAAFAAPVLAQPKECNDEFKAATYQKWYDNRKEHQDVAYEAAKDYLATCTAEDQYSAALKKFKDAYEKLTAANSVNKQFEDAYKNKNYADQIKYGKQIVATDPDNSAVYIIMGLAGLGDAAVLSESAQYAKKAIDMIEAGKPFKPFETKDQPLAYLNWEIGKSDLKGTPADAIPFFLKAGRLESDLKKKPQLYLDLAAAYNDGPRAKLTEEYKGKVGPNQTETPESKLALENLYQVLDRQIDALARAAALADAANKKVIMDELTDLYKYRNKSETGLTELVAGVLSKPLPDIPTPLTSLPATPSTSTPATNGSAQPGTAVSGTQTGSAKPVASPTPGNKPKSPRSN